MSGRSRAPAVLLWLMAAGIVVQAALAGTFISGVDADMQFVHLVVGSLLPYAALPVAVVGAVQWRRRGVTPGVGVGMVLLPVLVWTQSVLGHVPFPVGTAIHVPFGAGLLAYTVTPAVLASRSPGDVARRMPPADAAHPQVHPR
jgi:hypothetical protein